MTAQLFDHAFSYYMIGQAGKGLSADDIVGAGVDQFQHLSGQEPAFSCLVAQRNDVFCHIAQILNMGRGIEVPALIKLCSGRFAKLFQEGIHHIGESGSALLGAKIFCFKVLIVETVEQEIHQIRNYCLCTLRLQELYQMVVCSRKEFYQNLAHHTDFWFYFIGDRQTVKFLDDLPAKFFVPAVSYAGTGEKIDTFLFQLPMQLVGGTGYQLIGAHPVETAHEDIPKLCGEQSALQQRKGDLKTGVSFQTTNI